MAIWTCSPRVSEYIATVQISLYPFIQISYYLALLLGIIVHTCDMCKTHCTSTRTITYKRIAIIIWTFF